MFANVLGWFWGGDDRRNENPTYSSGGGVALRGGYEGGYGDAFGVPFTPADQARASSEAPVSMSDRIRSGSAYSAGRAAAATLGIAPILVLGLVGLAVMGALRPFRR